MEGEERQVKGRGGWDDLMAAFQHVKLSAAKANQVGIKGAAGETETELSRCKFSHSYLLIVEPTPTEITLLW